MWSNWQRPETCVCQMEMTAAVRCKQQLRAAVNERAHNVKYMWLYVCDCDCECLVFLFLQISKRCTTIETMRHSKRHSLSSPPWVKMAITWKYACHAMHVVCLLTYYAIWSCNLTAIIVKLQNNELNCLYFFTYHSQCTITVPIYQHCVILSSSFAAAVHHALCANYHSRDRASEQKKRSSKKRRKKP